MGVQNNMDWPATSQEIRVGLPPNTASSPRRAAPVRWEEIGETTAVPSARRVASVDAETLELRVELGRARLEHEQSAKLRKGSIVPLDEAVNSRVSLYAGDRLIGHGEPMVIDGYLAFRIVELFGREEPRECR